MFFRGMRCIPALVITCLLSACTVIHTPEIYKGKYENEDIIVSSPIETVADRIHRYSSRCLSGDTLLRMSGGGSVRTSNSINLKWTGKTRVLIEAPVLFSSTTYGASVQEGQTFHFIAEIDALDHKRTRIHPYYRQHIFGKALERWANNTSPACPDI